MIFVMMEKSTFDKSGIERHEVASEFLTLISFQLICDIETGLQGEKRSWGQSLTNDLDIFSTLKANTLSVVVFK